MNKTAIKNFAVWARNKLIADIEYKAGLMGITETGIASALPQSTSEVQFFDIGTKDYATVRADEIRQRNSLVSAINEKARDVGYSAAFHFIVEKTAYTWFNRLIAIRFMEVNDYLPSRVRVLSSENANKAEPDMVTKPFDTDMNFSQDEQDLIMRLKDENRLDELFRWLFIRQCFKLHEVLPRLFDSETDSDGRKNEYMELLLTISFTDKDGVLWRLVHDIRERDFRIRTEEDLERQKIENIPDDELPAGQVEIIGWMYQYYNTEPKDQVFADLKKNIKISKDKIPAATQLFTPDWIVRYMVENSLGRLWVEGHPNENLKKGWKYYLEEAEQEPEVQARLDEIRKGYAALRPEEIKAVDPCMGSGHILVYLFDVLMQIYESQGWTRREAAQSIVRNNLYGLDIDERAAQLAYFAVMMKARQYDRRFLGRGIEPHVYEIQESNGTPADVLAYFANGNQKLKKDMETLMTDLRDASEYGSILNVTPVDFPALYARFDEIRDDISMYAPPALNGLLPLVKRAEVMAQKYDVVVTNPPYMGASNMNSTLNQFIKDNYSDYKSDFFSVFVVKCSKMTKAEGYCGFFTPYVWMFIQSYEKLRQYLYKQCTIETLIQFEYSAFAEATVPVCTFAFKNGNISEKKGCYFRLTDFRGGMEVQRQKMLEAISNHNCGFYFEQATDSFSKIPGAPMAYWVSMSIIKIFSAPKVESIAFSDGQILTGDNDKYLRLIWEVNATRIGHTKDWMLHAKGGNYRKWSGNIEWVVNWTPQSIKHYKKDKIARFPKESVLYRYGVTWNLISTNPVFGARLLKDNQSFNKAAATLLFHNDKYVLYVLALLNSCVVDVLSKIINPTLNNNIKDMLAMPFVESDKYYEAVCRLTKLNVEISDADWDAFETSWDFKRHPLLPKRGGEA